MVSFIANIIWIILIITLMRQTRLEVLGTNVLGLAFLCIYGLIIVIQFLTLLWHRVETFFHVIARTLWRRGQLHMSWAFDDENLPPPSTDSDLDQVRRHSRRPCDVAAVGLLTRKVYQLMIERASCQKVDHL